MTGISKILVANIPSIICLSGTVYLLATNGQHWGWLLFAGVIMSVSSSNSD